MSNNDPFGINKSLNPTKVAALKRVATSTAEKPRRQYAAQRAKAYEWGKKNSQKPEQPHYRDANSPMTNDSIKGYIDEPNTFSVRGRQQARNRSTPKYQHMRAAAKARRGRLKLLRSKKQAPMWDSTNARFLHNRQGQGYYASGSYPNYSKKK